MASLDTQTFSITSLRNWHSKCFSTLFLMALWAPRHCWDGRCLAPYCFYFDRGGTLALPWLYRPRPVPLLSFPLWACFLPLTHRYLCGWQFSSSSCASSVSQGSGMRFYTGKYAVNKASLGDTKVKNSICIWANDLDRQRCDREIMVEHAPLQK